MNKIFLGFLVLLSGVAFGWYYLKGNVTLQDGLKFTPMSNPEPSITQDVMITEENPSGDSGEKGGIATLASVSYTDTGFSPKQITIKKGTKVTFKNESTKKMWVASGVHPTHQLLPGFDQLVAVGNDISYEYSFMKIGTWTYHNHINPTEEGIVVVTE